MLLPRASLAVIYVPVLVVLVSGAMAGAAAPGGAHHRRAIDAPADPDASTAVHMCAVDKERRRQSRDAGDAWCDRSVADDTDKLPEEEAARLNQATAAR